MFEAVNSTLSNAPLLRPQVEQVSAARSYAANPEKVQEVAQAPYISPFIHLDVNFGKAVLQIRDSDTGDVVRQFPSESALEAARREQIEESRLQYVAPKPSSGEGAQAAPQTVSQPREQSVPQSGSSTPEASAAGFGAFAKQVASLQTATSGGIGTTVSTEA